MRYVNYLLERKSYKDENKFLITIYSPCGFNQSSKTYFSENYAYGPHVLSILSQTSNTFDLPILNAKGEIPYESIMVLKNTNHNKDTLTFKYKRSEIFLNTIKI